MWQMQQYGILFASIVFYTVMVVLGVLFAWLGFAMVRKLYHEAGGKSEEKKAFPEGMLVSIIIKCTLLVAVYAVIGIGGWNLKQAYFSGMSDYQNPVQKEALKKLKEHKLPSNEELDVTKAELERRRDVKKHEEAFDSFEEQMKREAEKIRKRNQPDTTPAPVPDE
jgi:hypothetical protein